MICWTVRSSEWIPCACRASLVPGKTSLLLHCRIQPQRLRSPLQQSALVKFPPRTRLSQLTNILSQTKQHDRGKQMLNSLTCVSFVVFSDMHVFARLLRVQQILQLFLVNLNVGDFDTISPCRVRLKQKSDEVQTFCSDPNTSLAPTQALCRQLLLANRTTRCK